VTTQDLLREKLDGVGRMKRRSGSHTSGFRAFALATPTVYLVAHDPDTGTRLAGRRLLHYVEKEVAA
jgi:hypothetical protein